MQTNEMNNDKAQAAQAAQAERGEAPGGGEETCRAEGAPHPCGEAAPPAGEPKEDAGGGDAPSADEIIADLEARLAQASDQLLRKAADFDNYRKRMNGEKQSAIDFANQSLLLDIISVIDDFERAITAAAGAHDFAVLLDGVKMIEKQLVSQLENKWGLKRDDPLGAHFDPNIHEALMMEKSPETDEAKVTEVFAKGYSLKGRVIRAAKVKVVMPEAQAASGESGAAEGEGD